MIARCNSPADSFKQSAVYLCVLQVQDAFSPGYFGTAVLVTDRISGVELTLKKVQ